MIYEKARAELVLFDNFDVITTSGLDGSNLGSGDCKNKNHGSSGDCPTPGWSHGNGCDGTSGVCSNQSWH